MVTILNIYKSGELSGSVWIVNYGYFFIFIFFIFIIFILVTDDYYNIKCGA